LRFGLDRFCSSWLAPQTLLALESEQMKNCV
jgi:hypothetical protein